MLLQLVRRDLICPTGVRYAPGQRTCARILRSSTAAPYACWCSSAMVGSRVAVLSAPHQRAQNCRACCGECRDETTPTNAGPGGHRRPRHVRPGQLGTTRDADGSCLLHAQASVYRSRSAAGPGGLQVSNLAGHMLTACGSCCSLHSLW